MSSRRDPVFGPAAFYRESLGIVVPVMLQQAITALVSLVDNFMVAGLGDSKMAAVNVANQINFVYFVIVNVACMAGGIYLSQYRGAKDAEGMRQAFRFKLLLSGIVSLAYLALCNLVPEALVSVMLGGNAEGAAIVAEGASYLRIVSLGFVPIGMSSAIGSAFRDSGEPVPPLLISSFAALINTCLNWVLIYGNLGAPRLEITGAAIATDIARYCELAAFLLWVRSRRPVFAFSPKSFLRIDLRLFLSMLSRSLVMFFSETAWVLSETIITALYNGRGGVETVAGMAAGWTIANLIFLVFPGIHTATNVIVGSTLGSGRLDDARKRARWIMSGSVVLGAAGTVLAFASTLAIPFVFGNLSGPARLVTRGLVATIGVYLPLWCLLNAQFAVSRAGGDMAMGVWVDVGVTYGVFIPAALVLAYGTLVGPVALFAIAKITDIPKALVAAWWLRKGRWVRNLAAGDS